MFVVGFDDVGGGDLFDPTMTTITQPVFDISQRAIELLVRRVATPDAPLEVVVLEPRLIVRGSTAPTRGPDSSEEV